MSSTSYAKRGQPPMFGQWLRTLREQKKVTLREAAAAAAMDLAHLSKAELGQRLITREQTAKLAAYFGVDATEAEARRLAEKFRQEAQDDPAAAEQAVQFLAEEAGIYHTSATKGKGHARGR